MHFTSVLTRCVPTSHGDACAKPSHALPHVRDASMTQRRCTWQGNSRGHFVGPSLASRGMLPGAYPTELRSGARGFTTDVRVAATHSSTGNGAFHPTALGRVRVRMLCRTAALQE